MVQPVVQAPSFQFHMSYLQSTHTDAQVSARMIQFSFFTGYSGPYISHTNGKTLTEDLRLEYCGEFLLLREMGG
jgi:hypothetical protein